MSKLNYQMRTECTTIDDRKYSFNKSFKSLENAIERFNTFGCKTTKHIHSTVIDKETKQTVWECSKSF